MPDQYSFIIADPASGKTSPAERRQIRSHCMIGKNKREGSRRSRQTRHGNSNTPPIAIEDLGKVSTASDGSRSHAAIQWPMRVLPPLLDSRLLHVATEAGLSATDIVSQFFTFNDLKRAMYPAYKFVSFRTLDQRTSRWLVRDLAFVHSVVAVTSIYQSLTHKTPHFHLQQALSHLNQSLSSGLDASSLGPIIYTITMVAAIAAELGNYAELGVHLAGLRQIINGCGGDGYLRSEVELCFELHRLDLAYVAATGSVPIFLLRDSTPITWTPIFDAHHQLHDLEFTNSLTDPRLIVICHDLKHLTIMVNEHADQRSRIPGALFKSAVESIQSHLLQLGGDANCIIDECLRLGIMAFLTITLFQSPRGGGLSSRNTGVVQHPARQRNYIATHLRDACQAIEVSSPHLRKLVFWVLNVSAMSIYDIYEEPWLVEKWRYILDELIPGGQGGLSWEGVKMELESVFWINCVHDELGHKLFNRLIARSMNR